MTGTATLCCAASAARALAGITTSARKPVFTRMPVAWSGPRLATVTVNWSKSPTAGMSFSTLTSTATSEETEAFTSTPAESLSLRGSNSLPPVRVATFTDLAGGVQRGRGRQRAHRADPQAPARPGAGCWIVRPGARRGPLHGQLRGQRVAHHHPARDAGAEVRRPQGVGQRVPDRCDRRTDLFLDRDVGDPEQLRR